MNIRKLTLAFLLITGTLTAISQPPDDKHHSKEMREKIEAQKVAFITQKLDLSPEEAQTFWPVYNQHQEERHELHESMKENMDEKKSLDEMSDEEVLDLMDKHLEIRQKELDLDKKYLEEYKKVLPPKKVVKLHKAEREFKKHLIMKLKEHGHDGPKNGKSKRKSTHF